MLDLLPEIMRDKFYEKISGISQRTPTMVYDLRPMHLYTYISQLYLSSHFIRNDFSKTLNLFTVNMISLQ